jgi:hypothetical protein
MDAKVLKVLQSKPKNMSPQDWNMLCGYSFGMVIFGLPETDKDVPIPVSTMLAML